MVGLRQASPEQVKTTVAAVVEVQTRPAMRVLAQRLEAMEVKTPLGGTPQATAVVEAEQVETLELATVPEEMAVPAS